MTIETRFTKLRKAGLNAQANTVASFLALTNVPQTQTRSDLILLAGNGVLACVDHAASLARHHDCSLLLSGGIGHSTPLLAAAVAQRLNIKENTLSHASEADLLARVIREEALLTPDRLLLETHSTNTGENAAFSLALLDALGLEPRHVSLVQDPLLQRRTQATFRHHWRDRPTVFLSTPPFTPYLNNALTEESWTEARFLSLLLGEIPRLHDTATGYGPKGRGFIGHVDIPEHVLAAYATLAATFTDQRDR